MKEGWTYKKLGEVADVVHGKNQKEVLSENGQYPIYGSGGNIMGYANSYLCEAGTTILGRKGSINNPLFVEERFWNVDTAFGIYAKKGNDSKYIYYFIKSIDWSEKNTGTTLPSLTQQVVKSVELPIPNFSEQKRIVSRLDAAFSHIDELKANAEKQLSEARALFQKSLAKAIEPKDGWKESSFNDVFDDITDFVAAGSFADLRKNVIYNDKPDYAQLVRTTDIKHGFKNDSFVYISEHAFKYLWRVNLNEECIILPNVGVNCGEVYYLNPVNLPYKKNVLGPNAILIRSHSLNNLFMSYYLKGFAFQEQLRHITSSMAQPKYNKTNLKLLTVCFPSLSEQQRIVGRLDALSAHVRELEENQKKIISECDALKQALLRKVFE